MSFQTFLVHCQTCISDIFLCVCWCYWSVPGSSHCPYRWCSQSL